MTTGRARTMAAHLSRPQNQTCDRLTMEVTYCWCVPFFRTSLLLAPLDLCTYGYGVPPRPGPPASLAGGVFYWLCGTDLFAHREQNGCCLGIQAALAFPPSVTAMAGTTSPKSEPACITMQALLFPAHSHFHCTNRWSFADRITLAAYCARPLQHLKPADASLLEELGFQLP